MTIGTLAACGTSTNSTDTSASTTPSTTSISTDTSASGKVIGVAMPTQSLQRWNQDGENHDY